MGECPGPGALPDVPEPHHQERGQFLVVSSPRPLDDAPGVIWQHVGTDRAVGRDGEAGEVS